MKGEKEERKHIGTLEKNLLFETFSKNCTKIKKKRGTYCSSISKKYEKDSFDIWSWDTIFLKGKRSVSIWNSESLKRYILTLIYSYVFAEMRDSSPFRHAWFWMVKGNGCNIPATDCYYLANLVIIFHTLIMTSSNSKIWRSMYI